jgi:hypothetical protein
MTQKRLGRIVLLHTYQEKFDHLDLKVIAKSFIEANIRWKAFFRKFWLIDCEDIDI